MGLGIRGLAMLRLAMPLVAASAVATGAAPVAAQRFSDGYTFLKGVRDRDGEKVTDLLNRPGTTIVNTRDVGNGDTALKIVVARQDLTWLRFLLGKGADPNIVDGAGAPPLLQAVENDFQEGVRALIAARADVNRGNRSGETPLIRAVQRRNPAMVRLLIDNGANPDRRDSLAGMSAREYARADNRMPQLLQMMDSAKPKPAANVQGPRL